MTPKPARRAQRAFTIVELMIVVALGALLLALVGPSFSEFIVTQRLRAVTSELVGDMQYARSEAVSRGKQVHVSFKTPAGGASMSCYSVYTDSGNLRNACDCTQAAGSRCAPTSTELKTVQVPASGNVRMVLGPLQAPDFAFDPTTGGIVIPSLDMPTPPPNSFVLETTVDTARTLRAAIGLTGRPTVCRPSGSTVTGGYEACP
jgi:type IV fimbrial biogenesis protein FimT